MPPRLRTVKRMFAVFNRAIIRRSSCTLWRNSSMMVWPRSDFTREESDLSTKLNALAPFSVPLLPGPRLVMLFDRLVIESERPRIATCPAILLSG